MKPSLLLSLSLTLAVAGLADAQTLLVPIPDSQPIFSTDGFSFPDRLTRPNQRIRLLRFQPGFLSDPVNLFPDSSSASEVNEPVIMLATEESIDWMTFTMGNDNPFTDFRRPNGQGGVGFYRMVGQVQLLDSGTTGFSFNLQAVTPAGRQVDGVESGPTIFTPAVAIYHELATGMALHGFVGTNLMMNNFPLAAGGTGTAAYLPGTQTYRVEYGLAFQHPILLPENEDDAGVYLYLGALGRVTDWREPMLTRTPFAGTGLEMLPGLHWQIDRKTWLSGALVVPLQRTQRQDAPLWQLTAQIQF